MTDAEYETQKARIEGFLTRWLKPLGLGYWYIRCIYYRDSGEYQECAGEGSSSNALAEVDVDWQYCQARIAFNVFRFATVDDAEAEYAVVHELMHVFLNEMREDGINHEERVATMLAKGILWADAIHREESAVH